MLNWRNFSGGGQVYTQLKSGGNNCAQDAKVYELVHDLALDKLDANPVKGAPYSKKNDLILKCDICQIIRVVCSMLYLPTKKMASSSSSTSMDPIDEIFSNIMNISIPERMNLTVSV